MAMFPDLSAMITSYGRRKSMEVHWFTWCVIPYTRFLYCSTCSAHQVSSVFQFITQCKGNLALQIAGVTLYIRPAARLLTGHSARWSLGSKAGNGRHQSKLLCPKLSPVHIIFQSTQTWLLGMIALSSEASPATSRASVLFVCTSSVSPT